MRETANFFSLRSWTENNFALESISSSLDNFQNIEDKNNQHSNINYEEDTFPLEFLLEPSKVTKSNDSCNIMTLNNNTFDNIMADNDRFNSLDLPISDLASFDSCDNLLTKDYSSHHLNNPSTFHDITAAATNRQQSTFHVLNSSEVELSFSPMSLDSCASSPIESMYSTSPSTSSIISRKDPCLNYQ